MGSSSSSHKVPDGTGIKVPGGSGHYIPDGTNINVHGDGYYGSGGDNYNIGYEQSNIGYGNVPLKGPVFHIGYVHHTTPTHGGSTMYGCRDALYKTMANIGCDTTDHTSFKYITHWRSVECSAIAWRSKPADHTKPVEKLLDGWSD
jgi:hypothetical protein